MSDSDDEICDLSDLELKAELFDKLGGRTPSIKSAPAAPIIKAAAPMWSVLWKKAAPPKRQRHVDVTHHYVKHEIDHGGPWPFIWYIYIYSYHRLSQKVRYGNSDNYYILF